jgi:hypothetical protein
MTDQHAETLLQLLDRWSGNQPLRDNARVRLICRQPQNGAYAYLHRLYRGLDEEEIADIEATVGRSVPPRLREFYSVTNGARLFEGQVSVSGLVRDFSRDPGREGPISIEQDNLAFAEVRSQWHRKGFFRIGGISFLRQDELICGPGDRTVVLHARTGEPLRDYPNIFACLESFTREMSRFWTNDGTFGGDWDVIDQLLLGVNGTA